MVILLLFAFISGLVTILAPCIWPLLPIIFSTTSTGGRTKAFGISLGIVASFAFFTLTISYLVAFFNFDPDILRLLAVIVLTFLGLTLVIPKLTGIIEFGFSRLSSLIKFTPKPPSKGFIPGFVTGMSLGIVWSPCAGPILSTIAALSVTRTVNLGIVLVTLSYSAGVFIVLFLFSIGGNALFAGSRFLTAYTGIIQRIFGIIIILTAFSILINFDKVLQAKLLDAVPSYSDFIYRLESNDVINRALQNLKPDKDMPDRTGKASDPVTNMGDKSDGLSKLPVLYKAPELEGINNWLNTGGKQLTISSLKGKVVLVDFWTYTCINCIRTLPYVTKWYEKYRDDNFTVIGVHTPEFEFEKKTENVRMAIEQYNISYPVAQDNDYRTWTMFDNRYWPAKYLIDKDGYVRKYHFGEGKYEEMETAIRELIEEAGGNISGKKITSEGESVINARTPESYLGFDRMERFSSNEPITLGNGTYTTGIAIPEHHLAYLGNWNIDSEYGESVDNSSLEINFTAQKVFLVIGPKGANDRVRIYLDGKIIGEDSAGRDIDNGIVYVKEPKLYNLIDLGNKASNHLLRLEFLNRGIQVFAFTFG